MPVHVELDIFSGRPNPEWDATTDEEVELTAAIANLTEGVDGLAMGDRLGYRGFVVTRPSNAWAMRVWGTIVELRTATSASTRVDAGRVLERILVRHARGRVPDEVYDFLVAETAGPGES